ncbi:MAG: winged helix-turn-helix domain-containing protein [Prevotellaceae bacterium]|jgi:two-component system alkaline phosphatase synthesis response regulator PhoP|nr:winged helix-turn-helix domain-containing protein [Prevotellaceae bacterium]
MIFNKTILIIDYEKNFTTSVLSHLQNSGFIVVTANSKTQAINHYRKTTPDILLINEEFHYTELLTSIKHSPLDKTCPPVMLIVEEQGIANPVSAFYLRVNDCVVNTISPQELVLRIRRCLTTLSSQKPKIPLGRSLFLPDDYQIVCNNGDRIELLPKENELLKLLCNDFGEICSKDTITDALWGHKDPDNLFLKTHWQQNLDTLIYSVKKKIKSLQYIYIQNVKKVGYRLYVAEIV